MPSLILVPGLAGDAVMWRSQLDAFARWHPRVTSVHFTHDSIETMASALLAQEQGQLILCGASMGGMIAMEAARQAPQRIRGLALLGTIASPETPEMRRLREEAIALFAKGLAREVIEPNVALAFHPGHPGLKRLSDDYLGFVLSAGGEQLIRQNRAVIGRPDARTHLPQLEAPVLVMCGDSDQLTPVHASREIASLAPHARLVLVPQCGHMLTMEQPEFVNARLLEWLRELDDE